ncbi:MAG: hypothetical protein FWG45_01725 [Oscillospiraceae bacterium]|nr:hypothetical protein [Oscillospiraceae bacterium]
MKKALAGAVMVVMLVCTMAGVVGAVDYSPGNIDIPIVTGVYKGYRFFEPESASADFETSAIASVRFYVKFEGLEHHEPAMVSLAYNSGTTGWVAQPHDLNDGLIIDIEVGGGVAEGDYFEAALSTDDPAINGTFSVEARDWDGNVLGTGVYDSGITNEPDVDEVTGFTETAGTVVEETAAVQPPEEPTHGGAENPPTSTGSNILTATAMTIISALAIMSMKKRRSLGDD